MNRKLLVGLLSVLVGGVLAGVPASAAAAFPQFWTDSTKTTPLRSTSSVPKYQPDAMEFVNNGPVTFVLSPEAAPIQCNEVEFGTTVVVNNGELETKLALPFGVAEGDNCMQDTPLGVINVPTYFDTNAAGVVPANITVTGGPPFIATFHKLKISQNKAGSFCTLNLEGIRGELANAVEGFVEESPPNLNVIFEGPPIAVTCGKTKTGGILLARFFLDTMSTTTDTAFIG